jgi:S1-C subfamily serine protease
MKRILLALLLSVCTIFGSCAAGPIRSRAQVAFLTKLSLVTVSYQVDDEHTYVCGGFIVDSSRGEAITAKHCVVGEDGNDVENLFVNSLPTTVIRSNNAFALIKIPALMGPPLEFRKSPPEFLEDVIGLGYGFGDYTTVLRHISNPIFGFGHENDIVLDGPLAPGMSGGPVVDMDGKVVGLIQQNSPGNVLSLLCGAKEIQEFIKAK